MVVEVVTVWKERNSMSVAYAEVIYGRSNVKLLYEEVVHKQSKCNLSAAQEIAAVSLYNRINSCQ